MRTYGVLLTVLTALPVTTGAAWAQSPVAEYDANHCEFYIDSFVVGDVSVEEVAHQVLDVDFVVNTADLVGRQGDEIVQAGVWTQVRAFAASLDDAGQPVLSVTEGVRFITAGRLTEARYAVRRAFEMRAPRITTFEEIRALAFFMDVRRRDGQLVRLWIRDSGAPFTIEGIFGRRPWFEMSIGIGVLRYADPASPVYAQRRACT